MTSEQLSSETVVYLHEPPVGRLNIRLYTKWKQIPDIQYMLHLRINGNKKPFKTNAENKHTKINFIRNLRTKNDFI